MPAKPTGRLMFSALDRLRIVPATSTTLASIPRSQGRHRYKPGSSNYSASIPADPAEELQVISPETMPSHVLKARLAAAQRASSDPTAPSPRGLDTGRAGNYAGLRQALSPRLATTG